MNRKKDKFTMNAEKVVSVCHFGDSERSDWK